MNPNLNKVLLFLLLILPLLGMADSGYLVYEHFSGGTPVCIVGEGCSVVTTSEYSKIFGMPVALLGLIYYLLFFAGVLWFSIRERGAPLLLLRILLTAGLIFSAWFVYVQIFLINAICFYCMVSASISLISFVLIWFLRPGARS